VIPFQRAIQNRQKRQSPSKTRSGRAGRAATSGRRVPTRWVYSRTPPP